MAESELAVLTRQCLTRRIPDKQTLDKEVAAWERHRNKHHAKADWQFTTHRARVKFKGCTLSSIMLGELAASGRLDRRSAAARLVTNWRRLRREA